MLVLGCSASPAAPPLSQPAAMAPVASDGAVATTASPSLALEPPPSPAPPSSTVELAAADAEQQPLARPIRKPEAVVPPFSASARPGDGQWLEYAEPDVAQALLWRTTLHPHRVSAFVSVSVVAIDLDVFTLDWVVGAGDEGAEKLSAKVNVGLVTDDAVALFNGGFQARHGRWGQVSHGVTLVPPRPEGCGIALTTDGSVELGVYADVSALDLVTYRQTPPCLVSEGSVNPLLVSGQDKVWAGKSEREKTRRRSALGLRRDTRTLYYLVGVETNAIDLARALVALGVDIGVQLDINWNWTRFFLVGQKDTAQTVHTPLLDGMVMDAAEYVRRPSKRDFFVVRARR